MKRRKLNENFLEENSFREVLDDMKNTKMSCEKLEGFKSQKYLIHQIKNNAEIHPTCHGSHRK